jgi:hypothetical protein
MLRPKNGDESPQGGVNLKLQLAGTDRMSSIGSNDINAAGNNNGGSDGTRTRGLLRDRQAF